MTPASVTPAQPTGYCLLYSWPPWLDTSAVKIFGYWFAEMYALVVCVPAMDIELTQQGWEEDLNGQYYAIENQAVSGEATTPDWDYVTFDTCSAGDGGYQWAWKQLAQAFVVLGSAAGAGSDWSSVSHLYCNAL